MRSEKLKKKLSQFFWALLAAHFLTGSLLLAAQPNDLEEQTRAIAAELRCPVCQNLSVADSPSELAQQMRALIQEQLNEGKSSEEIKKFFVSKYGDWILLAPPAKGLGLLLWVLPGAAVALGALLVALLMRRWVRNKDTAAATEVDPALLERIQREVASAAPAEIGSEGETQRSLLLAEQARLYAELRELEFDFHSGKLSEADYGGLRHDLERQATAVLRQLESVPAEPRPRTSSYQTATRAKKIPATETRSLRQWQVAAGGLFLLLFGVTLGVLLTKSLRPRGSEQDTITGDFLTGTQSSNEPDPLLAQGRAAFERRDWAQAIETFKKVLAANPNHPEAHAYMGLMLAQAGHTEGALMAFDRALAADPNFPLALWGKGMLLYRTNGDAAGARELLQKLESMMPAGAEKQEVEKIIAELGQGGDGKKSAAPRAQVGGIQIQGVVDVDPKLKGKVDSQAVLFIIARSATSAGGPPLAVKKIARPSFPVAYSLGAEDVMLPGASFSGKLFLSARLDKDGNPTTRETGNLAGEYPKNPVDAGSKKVDIVLDQVM